MYCTIFRCIFIMIILVLGCDLMFGQGSDTISKDPKASKDEANLKWDRKYTLFDFETDEPIFPWVDMSGKKIYHIYLANKENPHPEYRELDEAELQKDTIHYKFKNRETCMIWCLKHLEKDVPIVVTWPVSDKKQNSLKTGGKVINDKRSLATERGVVISEDEDPRIGTSKKIMGGSGIGLFSLEANSLNSAPKFKIEQDKVYHL